MSVNDYPYGQCTYYVATRFPGVDGHMGNAKEWVSSAMRLGYPVSSTPLPDSVAVFGPGDLYSQEGHVAVVDSVNGDGTFNVSEMNFNGLGIVDQRRASMANVLGFVVPPGSMAPSTLITPIAAYVPHGAAPSVGSQESVCITKWTLSLGPLNTAICMDGIVGGAAMAAGGVLMLVGGTMIIALALHQTSLGKAAAKNVGMAAGPAGKVIALHAAREQRQKQAATQQHKDERQQQRESHEDAMRRAQVRTARARARIAEGRARAPKSKEPITIDTRTPEGKARAQKLLGAA